MRQSGFVSTSRAVLCVFAGLMLLPVGLAAEEVGPEPLLLWPEGAPGAVGNEGVDKPSIRIYPAGENATGTAVVICPGGGYGALAFDHEGHQIAKFFNTIGVTGVVLKYRLGRRYQHPAPLQDVQRAIRLVRSRADDFGIDPQRIGVMGFSAGGHLASTASTHFDAGDPEAKDVIDRASCRPDFSILAYPVISLKSDFGHTGSRRNLLGENPDPALVESLSTETRVTAETPPTFLFHTTADTGVPPQNSLVYYRALVEHGVPAELHIYQNGPHGVGLAPADPVLNTWSTRLHDWLKVNGFLAPRERANVQGRVMLDGSPLRWGMVAFVPDPTVDRHECLPTSTAMISRGQFNLSGRAAPVVGRHRVVVVSLGSVEPRPTIDDAHMLASQETGLVVDITPGQNDFAFELTSN